jgi:uncharacterized protein YukE
MSFLPDFTNVVARLTNGRTLDTSDEALDSAAGFQDGFSEYLPLYNEYTGSSLSMEADIQRPYDELREIDFGRLAEVAEQSASVADEFQETRDEINTRVGEVTGWSGDASNAFLAYVQRFQTAAQTIDTDLGNIATATGEAVPAVQGVITEYVEAIGEIDFSDFDSPEIIRILITIEGMAMSVSELLERLYDGIGDLIGMALPVLGGGGGGFLGGVPVVGDVVDAVSGFVGDMIGEALDFFGGADELLALASRLARGYLDASFKQPFENNFQLLHDAVEAAKQGVTESFQPMVDAANAVTQAAFAQLGAPPEDNPNQQAQPPPPSDENHDQSGSPPEQTQQSQPVQSPGGVGGTVSPTPSTPPVSTPPVGTPPVTAPPGGGGDLLSPEPLPQPQPMPPGPGDGPGGRPDDLPPGAGWVSDPSQLPQGWTVDPETGELLPPGAPGGEGDPEVHSPEGQDVLDGDVTTLPAPDDGLGTPSEVTMEIGDMTITISGTMPGEGSGEAIGLTLTDADGDSARYEIRIDENGNPELVPVEDAGGFKHEPPIMTTMPGGPADAPTVTAAPAGPAASPPFATEAPVGAGTPGFTAEAPAAATGAPAFAAGGPVGAPADVPAAAAPPPGLQPATTAPAAEGFTTGAVPAGGGPSFAAGQVPGGPGAPGEVPVGGPSVATGGVSPGGSSHATGQVTGGPSFAAGPNDGGFAVSGSVSGGGGDADGSAQLASASDTGAPTGPGAAQLPSAAEEVRAAHGGTGTGGGAGGAPFMPMGGGMAGAGGDEERRGGGTWQVPGTDIFEPEERTAARIRGVLGEDG